MEREVLMKRLNEHLEAVCADGYNPVYIALQGSQNYQLDYKNSDVDTKAIVLPTFEDIVFNKKMVSTTYIMENNEHCDLKDIRLMFNNFKKQNINFLEVLFSPYYWVDERYEEEFEQLRAHAEEIAHYNENVAVKCMLGMAKEKYKAMEHPYPTLIDKIEKYGYDGKQLHHIVRMREFMERYIDGEPFGSCLISNHREYLLKLKKNELPLKEARIIAGIEIGKMEKEVNDFLLRGKAKNQKTDTFLADWLVKLFTKVYCEK
jgi:predicted nucleotidyltransferase